MSIQKILIIEDHNETRIFLEKMLGQKYQILVAENAVIGMDYARTRSPNLILLDVVLPILNGMDACSLLKQDERTKKIPIFILSVKNSPADIKRAFSVGADDFISKPFDFKELEARIENKLKTLESSEPKIIEIGQLKLNPSTREVHFEGKEVFLTLTEFDLLRFLVTKRGAIVSREEILSEIWKDHAQKTNDRTIDVHVRALRKKMPDMMRHILSIYGVGYKYEE